MGNRVLVGIDPGISGSCAVLDEHYGTVAFHDMPTLNIKVGKKFKNVPNIPEMVRILKGVECERTMVAIEKVNAMPDVGTGAKMGATSAFSFGMGFGIWLGILATLEIPYEQVHPATWKSKLMNGMGKEKDASRIRAMELYPKAANDLSRKKDHGRADALLLAHYLLVTGITPQVKQEPEMQGLFEHFA